MTVWLKASSGVCTVRLPSRACQCSFSFGQLGLRAAGRSVLGRGPSAHGARLADPQHHDQLPRLARRQVEVGLQRAARVVAVRVAVAARAPFHRQRVVIAAIGADERLAAGIIARDRRAGQRHPAQHRVVVLGRRVLAREIIVDRDAQQAVLQPAARR